MATEIKHGTGISWTHVRGYRGETWNPVTGCTPASGSEKGGCLNCYARVLHDQRHRANRQVARMAWEYARIRPDKFATPFEMICWARDARANIPMPPQYDRPFSQVQLLPDRLDQPLHWCKPRAIFVDSMSDLFHDDVPDGYLDRVWATMALTPQHIYMVLTKRPERMREYVTGARERIGATATMLGLALNRIPDAPAQWPLPHVWLGVSVEDQAAADERIPLLLGTPAAVRFISAEPLLGPVDLMPYMGAKCENGCHFMLTDMDGAGRYPCGTNHTVFGNALHWIIVGGESGPRWRPMEHEWAASIRDQCAAAGVAYFGKQDAGARSGIALPSPLNEQAWPEVT